MLAVVPVRDGLVPPGAHETIAECGGAALVAGSGEPTDTRDATDPFAPVGDLADVATTVRVVHLGPYGPARWAALLAPLVADDPLVVLPASADGRDLAPRLAASLDRPLLAEAMQVGAESATLIRGGGLELHDMAITGPVVVTLHPGVRSVEAATGGHGASIHTLDAVSTHAAHGPDAVSAGVDDADLATMDLSEAARIVGGGAGLDGPDRFEQLGAIARAIGAVVGATRVVTDRAWVGLDRQIGTTGVVVNPRLYMALAISGAVQHTAGLGHPEHVISVNTDPHCPMMQLADLAVVADANRVVEALHGLLVDGQTATASSASRGRPADG